VEPERVPASYYVPASLGDAIDRLAAHGVVMATVKTAQKFAVEEFRIDSSVTAPKPFQNHNERTVTGAWVKTERLIPAGTLRIDVAQARGRLAFYLIEPRADDGLVNWNLLDEALEGARTYPILRSAK
jgi:hypothetical protein